MHKFTRDNLLIQIQTICMDFLYFIILLLGFFWRPIFVDKDLFSKFSSGLLFYFIFGVFLMYLFMRFVVKVRRISSFLSAIVFTFGGSLLQMASLDSDFIKSGWLLRVYVGIFPILLLRLAFLDKRYEKHSKFFFFLFLFSSLEFLKIAILKYLYILTNFALAVLAGLGMDSFISAFNKKEKRIFRLYTRHLNAVLFFIIIVVMPILYALLLKFYRTGLENTAIKIIGNICLIFIYFALGVGIFNLRLIKKGRHLFGLILFLVIIDIFSYWGMFQQKDTKEDEALVTQQEISILN